MAMEAAIPGLAITGCVFCGILAALHIYIFILEAVLWQNRAARVFQLPQSTVDIGITLAANQGFYNLLLSAGLIWGLTELDGKILLYFSAAIAMAGIFGAITASPRILFVQVIPGSLAFIFVAFGFYSTKVWSYWRHPLYQLIIFVGAIVLTAILSFIIKVYFLKTVSKPSSTSSSTKDNL